MATGHSRWRRARRRLSGVASVALAVALLAPGSGRAAARPDPAPVAPVVHARVVASSPGGVAAYWTHARMRAATPIDLATDGTTIPADTTGGAQGGVRARVAQEADSPASVGRLFFTTPDGDASCSAATVNTISRDQIITAGHCVNEGPVECGLLGLSMCRTPNFTNFLFVPRYRDSTAPYGAWVGVRVSVPIAWVTQVDAYAYDQAAITLAPSAGRAVVDVVGGNGLAWSYPTAGTPVQAWGWPAQAPYNGARAYVCPATTVGAAGSPDVGIDCPMNGGASGGPWFLAMTDARVGFISAVTSRRSTAGPAMLFAVPFSPAILQLFANAPPSVRSGADATARIGDVAKRKRGKRVRLVAVVDDLAPGAPMVFHAQAKGRAHKRTKLVLEVRYSGQRRWHRTAKARTDKKGSADFVVAPRRSGTVKIRINSRTWRSRNVRVTVHGCPLPSDLRRSVIRATQCTGPG